MSEFEKYYQMRASGKSPEEVYHAAKNDGANEITCIRLLREVFDLSLEGAKRAVIVASGHAGSLDEYQNALKPRLDEALGSNLNHENDENIRDDP